MDVVLLVARLVLAAVFAVAGLAKLADRAGTRQALRNFGIPAALASPLGVLLPLAELAVAVALVPRPSAWWGAAGALALLLLFVVGIGINLARGRKPDCHCFGQIYSAPIGWPTLARNAVLAAVAGFVVWQGRADAGRSAVGWLGDLTTVQRLGLAGGVIALGLLAAMAWLLIHLVGQHGRLLLRLEALEERLAAGAAGGNMPAPAPAEAALPAAGLRVGSPAPGFSLPGLYGETLTLDFWRATGKPVMLIFTDPNCGPCNALLPEIGRWQHDYAATLAIAPISRGTPEANRAKSVEHGLTHVMLQEDREVAEAYQVVGTPSAVIVRPDGTIGSPLAAGVDEIRALLARTVGAPGALPVAPSAPAPVLNGSGHNGAVPTANAAAPAAVPVQAAGGDGRCPNCGQVHGNGNGAAAVPVQPSGAQVGDPAPAIRLPDLSGRTVDLADFRGSPTLVLFWNPGCGFCQQMLPDLKAWEASPPPGAPKLLVVSTGGVEANQAQGLRAPVLLEPGFNLGFSFGINGTPSAILVDAEGRIASPPAVGGPAVMALARGEPAPSANGNGNGAVPPPAARVGQPAPAIKLPDLKGKTVNLAGLRGNKTVVLFWNPGCGFCQQMLPDLKAWEANPPRGAPRLLVVSTGSVEDNRALGLRSPVVLDQLFAVGSAFGASGTPSAVLVDTRGNVASEVVVGAPAVMGLLGAGQGQPQPA